MAAPLSASAGQEPERTAGAPPCPPEKQMEPQRTGGRFMDPNHIPADKKTDGQADEQDLGGKVRFDHPRKPKKQPARVPQRTAGVTVAPPDKQERPKDEQMNEQEAMHPRKGKAEIAPHKDAKPGPERKKHIHQDAQRPCGSILILPADEK